MGLSSGGTPAPSGVGGGSNIQDNCVLHCELGQPLTLGQNVVVGHGAILHGCTVEDGCLIGMGATLLDGCVIGEGSIVAAGALVPRGKVIPPRSLVMGCRARWSALSPTRRQRTPLPMPSGTWSRAGRSCPLWRRQRLNGKKQTGGRRISAGPPSVLTSTLPLRRPADRRPGGRTPAGYGLPLLQGRGLSQAGGAELGQLLGRGRVLRAEAAVHRRHRPQLAGQHRGGGVGVAGGPCPGRGPCRSGPGRSGRRPSPSRRPSWPALPG